MASDLRGERCAMKYIFYTLAIFNRNSRGKDMPSLDPITLKAERFAFRSSQR